MLQKSRIDPWIYTVIEELVLHQLRCIDAERQTTAEKSDHLPGVLRHALSCLQFLTQHISDCAELFRVYGVLSLKANRHADAVYSWLKEFRTLQVRLNNTSCLGLLRSAVRRKRFRLYF